MENSQNINAMEQMANAQFLAGLTFNNPRLGYANTMARQLSGFYDLPHCVCNALLLHAQEYNVQVVLVRLKDIAKAMSGCVQHGGQTGG